MNSLIKELPIVLAIILTFLLCLMGSNPVASFQALFISAGIFMAGALYAIMMMLGDDLIEFAKHEIRNFFSRGRP